MNRLYQWKWPAAALAILAGLGLLWLGPKAAARASAHRHEALARSATAARVASAAETQWLAALADWPDDADAYIALADLYRAYGQPEVAAACYQRILHIAPQRPHIYCSLASLAEDAKSDNAAYLDSQQELKRDPNCPTALAILGALDRHAGNTQKALTESEKAYRLSPKEEQTVLAYAQNFIPDEPDRAAAVLEPATKDLPQSWRVAYLLGWCYGHGAGGPSAPGKSMALLRRAESLQPDEGIVHREIARQLLLSSQMGEAVKEGAQAVKGSPYDPQSYQVYSQVLERLGRHAEAARAQSRAQSLLADVDNVKAVGNLYTQSHYDPGLAHRMARLHEELGDNVTALNVVREALSAHPEDAQLRQDLEHLLQTASGP